MKKRKDYESRFLLRQVLFSLNVSEAELGRRIGISRQMVHKLVNWDSIPRLDRLFQIADALEISPRELLRK